MDLATATAWWLAGAVASLVVTAVLHNPLRVVVDRERRRLRRLRARYRKPDLFQRDHEADGVFTLLRWSPERPLLRDPSLHRVEFGAAPGQDWFPSAMLRHAQRRQAEGRKGKVAYAYGMTVDHREHEDAYGFVLKVAESNYGDLNAIGSCIGRDDLVEFVGIRLHARGAVSFLATMPPTRLSIQVAVLSPDGNLLAIRRSGAVESVAGLWTLGPNETMISRHAAYTPGAKPESLYDLAERCLAEELGVVSDARTPEYGPIHITWFGLSAHATEGVAQNVLSVTTTLLSQAELAERIANAHSNFEADGLAWIPFTRRGLVEEFRSSRREWVNFSPLAAEEAWRYRALLESDLAAF